jgi:hypothetical protein
MRSIGGDMASDDDWYARRDRTFDAIGALVSSHFRE